VKLLALAAATLALATPAATGVSFLQSRQLDDGSFAERGARGYPQLTAWAVLGLCAAGAPPGLKTARYLQAREQELTTATDLALVALAELCLGQDAAQPLARLHALERPSGAVGRLVNGTAWSVLAFRAAGMPVSTKTIHWLVARQNSAGGWGWNPAAADSNDTAAVIQALVAAHFRGRPVRRGLAFLLRYYRNRDGGFELTPGRGSDAQSTAWAVQAFVAAGRQPPRGALAYLRGLERADGSFKYSRRYSATPVWVTAQVLPALALKPFPLVRG
jgi:energy-coupling factor transport system substrate-specific component